MSSSQVWWFFQTPKVICGKKGLVTSDQWNVPFLHPQDQPFSLLGLLSTSEAKNAQSTCMSATSAPMRSPGDIMHPSSGPGKQGRCPQRSHSSKHILLILGQAWSHLLYKQLWWGANKVTGPPKTAGSTKKGLPSAFTSSL